MGTTETALSGRPARRGRRSTSPAGRRGGAGASVGAGIVPIALASDGGGSIRIPAACCGVVGLKPSRGRISFGPDAGEPLSGWAVRFAVSRSVRDSAALLDALHGPEPGDPTPAAGAGALLPRRVLPRRRAGCGSRSARSRGTGRRSIPRTRPRPRRRRGCWPTSATPSTGPPRRRLGAVPAVHGRHVERQHRPRHRRVRGRPRPRAVARQPGACHLRDVALRLGAERLAGAGGP